MSRLTTSFKHLKLDDPKPCSMNHLLDSAGEKDDSSASPAESASASSFLDDSEFVAAQKALRTYELLVQVLLQLPIPRIYVLQRVNSDWRDVVKDSKALQQRMFQSSRSVPVEPRPSGIRSDSCKIYDHPGMKLSPMLTINEWFGEDTMLKAKAGDCRAITAEVVPRGSIGVRSGPSILTADVVLRFPATKHNEHESWMAVPITRPPITEVCMQSVPFLFVKTYRCEKGFTMGDIYDTHKQFIEDGLREEKAKIGRQEVLARFSIIVPTDPGDWTTGSLTGPLDFLERLIEKVD